MQRYPHLYSSLRDSESGCDDAIDRDLHRTFPREPMYSEPKKSGGQGQISMWLHSLTRDHCMPMAV